MSNTESWITEKIRCAENSLFGAFNYLNEIEHKNTLKILNAFRENAVSVRHFTPTTGYGYDDVGRDTFDKVFAAAMGCEDAIVRPQIVSGTHAIYIALSALLKPGQTLLSVTGKPYDTLEEAIGISGGNALSLMSRGVSYTQVELDKNGEPDRKRILESMNDNVSVVYLQRSRGYSERGSIPPEGMAKLCGELKESWPDAVILVDNCYGEFVCETEPTECGADVIAGSLIKNPGGGLAPTGGYIAGKKEYIELCAEALTLPGLGREVGSYAASYQPFYQGLFMAPHTVTESLKGAILFAGVFEDLGFNVCPRPNEKRYDIIQSIELKNEKALLAFCNGIQKASPVDSMALPLPWDMPGYSHQVVMAAGTFVQGASIELSADAPVKPPYNVYIQGGLTYAHCRLGVMSVLDEMVNNGLIHPD